VRKPRILLKDLAPRERKLLCNGAGPQNCRWLARLIPELCFRAAACQHDIDYWQGNRVADKVAADALFCWACLCAAWRKRGWRCRLFICLSFVYFLAVAACGWLCFNFRHRLGREDVKWLEQKAEAERHLKGA
jgi:hypothetical protein